MNATPPDRQDEILVGRTYYRRLGGGKWLVTMFPTKIAVAVAAACGYRMPPPIQMVTDRGPQT